MPRTTAAAPRFRLNPSLVITSHEEGLRVTDAMSGQEYAAPPAVVSLLVAFSGEAPLAEALAPFRDDRLPALRASFRQLVAWGLLVPSGERSPSSPWSAMDRAFHTQMEHEDAGHVPASTPPRRDRAHVARDRRKPIALARWQVASTQGFREVLLRRRTVRSFSRRPMTLDVLATFLGDAAAAHDGRRATPTATRYSLVSYVVCYRVAGLEEGVYEHDPDSHSLRWVTPLGREGARLLRRTSRGMGGPTRSPTRGQGKPSVVIVSTALFGRALPEFRRIGYHLILREAGAQLQTFYLVAASLGLAPCVLGAWEGKRLDAWLGLDGVHEGVVGVFALGVPASASATPPTEVRA